MASESYAPRSFAAVDPATGVDGPTFIEASSDEVAAAVTAAARIHSAGVLRDAAVRAALLRAAAAALREDGSAIVAVCRRETALTEARLLGELERTCRQLDAFADVVATGDEIDAIIDPAVPDALPLPQPDVRRMLIPLGPVAVFGASNFPLAFGAAGGDTASALAAGCPVIVKGHPAHPGTSQLVADAVSRAIALCGLPPGVYALLQASGPEIGELLIEQRELAAVAFTGSFQAGRALERRAAARPVPIPVFAEMGSVNPVVLSPGALAERGEAIATGLAAAVTGSGGQLCTKPGVVLLPTGDAAEAFIATIARTLDAAEPAVLLGAGVHARFRQGLEELEAARATAPRAVEQIGFRQEPVAARSSAADVLVRPALLDERFGPFVLLVTYSDEAELLAVLDALDGQLTAALHTARSEHALLSRLAAILGEKAGRLVFDGFATGVAVNYAMNHGGPFPATTAPGHTSVGMTAMRRFMRPLAWQDAPDEVLPPELRDANPLGIQRRIGGVLTRDRLTRLPR
jgi:NADP-dependent aldehyde dehydrogenase